MEYTTLLSEATSLGLIVKEANLKTSDGLCKGNRICINRNILLSSHKLCVLAEEIGHYFTTVGNIINQNDIYNAKQEKIARRWAHDKLIGLLAIAEAYEKGIRCKFELAEYLNVTVSFLDEAVANYKQRYGPQIEVSDYLFTFEPFITIDKI